MQPGEENISAGDSLFLAYGHARRGVIRHICSGALCIFSATALAATPPPPLTLKVACFALFPFAMYDEHGVAQGITVETAKLLARESGLSIEVQVVPYPRAVAMLTSGAVDLMFGFSNPQLERFAHPLGVVAVGHVVLLGRAGNLITQREDLRGKTVGHVRGAQYDEELQNDPAVAKYETVSYQQAVQMLLAGRIDAVLGVRVSLLGVIHQLGIPRESVGRMLVLSRREMLLHYSAKRYRPELAKTLARALKTLRENGKIVELYKPYE